MGRKDCSIQGAAIHGRDDREGCSGRVQFSGGSGCFGREGGSSERCGASRKSWQRKPLGARTTISKFSLQSDCSTLTSISFHRQPHYITNIVPGSSLIAGIARVVASAANSGNLIAPVIVRPCDAACRRCLSNPHEYASWKQASTVRHAHCLPDCTWCKSSATPFLLQAHVVEFQAASLSILRLRVRCRLPILRA